jgi:hypothetical protein
MVMSEEKGDVLAKMDAAAEEAEKDLGTLDRVAIEAVAAWWLKWYMKAGHKRLGRIMVKVAKSK